MAGKAVYHLIICQPKYKLFRVGAKKATATFTEGYELQSYIGRLVLNRDCKIYKHNSNGEVVQVINSEKSQGGKG